MDVVNITPKYMKDVLRRNLIYLRKRNKLSQIGLSRLSGLSYDTIRNSEQGRSGITIETLCALCRAYNVLPHEFYLDLGDDWKRHAQDIIN